jgi:hypothetical protein
MHKKERAPPKAATYNQSANSSLKNARLPFKPVNGLVQNSDEFFWRDFFWISHDFLGFYYDSFVRYAPYAAKDAHQIQV